MMAWESGMAVCEVREAGIASAHDHSAEPLACDNCGEFACDFHGDHSREDEEWLCAYCYEAEGRRLADAMTRA